MKKQQQTLTSEEKANMESIWSAEGGDGRYVIDRTADGGLFLVDYGRMDPDDNEDMSGIFSFYPEDADDFLEVMKKAVVQNEVQKMVDKK